MIPTFNAGSGGMSSSSEAKSGVGSIGIGGLNMSGSAYNKNPNVKYYVAGVVAIVFLLMKKGNK